MSRRNEVYSLLTYVDVQTRDKEGVTPENSLAVHSALSRLVELGVPVQEDLFEMDWVNMLYMSKWLRIGLEPDANFGVIIPRTKQPEEKDIVMTTKSKIKEMLSTIEEAIEECRADIAHFVAGEENVYFDSPSEMSYEKAKKVRQAEKQVEKLEATKEELKTQIEGAQDKLEEAPASDPKATEEVKETKTETKADEKKADKK